MKSPLKTLAWIFALAILIPGTMALSIQDKNPNVKTVPPPLQKAIEEADIQVANSYAALMKTAEGQAWIAAQNFRDTQIMYAMSEMGLKRSEGWVALRDKENGKILTFVKQVPTNPEPAGKP